MLLTIANNMEEIASNGAGPQVSKYRAQVTAHLSQVTFGLSQVLPYNWIIQIYYEFPIFR